MVKKLRWAVNGEGCWQAKTRNECQVTVKECEFKLTSVKCEVDVKSVSSNS
jgi:hypothetical protein